MIEEPVILVYECKNVPLPSPKLKWLVSLFGAARGEALPYNFTGATEKEAVDRAKEWWAGRVAKRTEEAERPAVKKVVAKVEPTVADSGDECLDHTPENMIAMAQSGKYASQKEISERIGLNAVKVSQLFGRAYANGLAVREDIYALFAQVRDQR